ncbi:hypothetical protein [Escherichia phage AV127]|nr:hypothetical protein [Escherichia phage AV127]
MLLYVSVRYNIFIIQQMSCATMNPIVKVFEGKNITFSSINRGTKMVPLIVVKGSDLAKALGYSHSKKNFIKG